MQRSLSEEGAWLWQELGIPLALAHGEGAVRMQLFPSPGTPSCLFRVGRTSQGGNETLWEAMSSRRSLHCWSLRRVWA